MTVPTACPICCADRIASGKAKMGRVCGNCKRKVFSGPAALLSKRSDVRDQIPPAGTRPKGAKR